MTNKLPLAAMNWLLALGSKNPEVGILTPLLPSALTVHLLRDSRTRQLKAGEHSLLLSKWTELTRVGESLEGKVLVVSHEDSQ